MPPEKPGRDRSSGGFVFVWLPWRERSWKCGVVDYKIEVSKLRRGKQIVVKHMYGVVPAKDGKTFEVPHKKKKRQISCPLYLGPKSECMLKFCRNKRK